MTRKHWLAVIGAIGVAAAMTGCKDSVVREYLAPGGKLEDWELRTQRAVCQLEGKSTGLDPNKQLCPPGGPVDGTPPPNLPK